MVSNDVWNSQIKILTGIWEANCLPNVHDHPYLCTNFYLYILYLQSCHNYVQYLASMPRVSILSSVKSEQDVEGQMFPCKSVYVCKSCLVEGKVSTSWWMDAQCGRWRLPLLLCSTFSLFIHSYFHLCLVGKKIQPFVTVFYSSTLLFLWSYISVYFLLLRVIVVRICYFKYNSHPSYIASNL